MSRPHRWLLPLLLAAACSHSPNKKERDSAEIHHGLGIEALRNNRPQDAMREFDAALATDDAFPEAHLGRGVAFELFGRAAEAEREYRRAIELRPDYSEAHNDLGQLLARTHRPQEALAEFDAALANMYYATPFDARMNRALVLYHQLDRKDEGQAELRTALSQSPRSCAGLRELGRIQLDQGRPAEALESFERWSRACDHDANAQFQIGLVHLKRGDAEKARAAFEKCEELGADGDVANECRRRRELLQ
ncbi:MAG TPA: tetratricopeptide repeat protein [Anaeromyxobacteraceae bacterium]|jgi:type IV pilus biogenesis/stability protein PilW|nr:tetratricopeptide repeat protein [Anaeromyxobacteraceae bacterium]